MKKGRMRQLRKRATYKAMYRGNLTGYEKRLYRPPLKALMEALRTINAMYSRR